MGYNIYKDKFSEFVADATYGVQQFLMMGTVGRVLVLTRNYLNKSF